MRHTLLVGAGLAVGIPWALAAEEDEGPVPQLTDPADILKRYPPFETTERIPKLEENGYYPCADCHDNVALKPNREIRQLTKDHRDVVLKHGGGRYWCTTCHHLDDRNSLIGFKGDPISFDQPFLLCGQCHFDRQKDFFIGAHGKRIGSWQGERLYAVCTDCHNPHDPRIPARKPQPPPKLRAGIRAAGEPHADPAVWERRAAAHEEHR